MPLLPTPNYTLIDTATAIPQLPCKDSTFDYTPNFILDNIDPIFMLIISILYFLLILDIVREIRTLRKENAALAQALMNEEDVIMSTPIRYCPGKELSDWQTSADELSGMGAKYFSFGQALIDEEKANIGTPTRYCTGNEPADWQTSANEFSGMEAKYCSFGQALLDEEKASIGTPPTRDCPGNELSDWQTSADQEAEYHIWCPCPPSAEFFLLDF